MNLGTRLRKPTAHAHLFFEFVTRACAGRVSAEVSLADKRERAHRLPHLPTGVSPWAKRDGNAALAASDEHFLAEIEQPKQVLSPLSGKRGFACGQPPDTDRDAASDGLRLDSAANKETKMNIIGVCN